MIGHIFSNIEHQGPRGFIAIGKPLRGRNAHSPENPARAAILTLSALWPFIKKLSSGLVIIPHSRWFLQFFLWQTLNAPIR
ncbi:hypothetical protein KG487_004272 [Salmonella enterica subsp. enterica serovar 4,5,12:b:-]|nr:hypothetical protein [Salmonella enterica]EHF1447861.1 hypothetical protein [Salmonella enterica subsp. enterica serovar 4,5,12:b:-]EHG1528280.1 hypothetical protein [Salmonella enterica subsp. enterica serovar 4,[5],12:b:-]EFB0476999.1 hypothetical protein [Salmonella enterica]EFQ4600118.1 hypothetical protein [Salmonella enterica]